MNKSIKSSLAILKQEFRLQFVSAGFILMLFIVSMLLVKYQHSGQNELSKLFIMFYTITFGFALPWQINTKGHIVPEYCRYNLNLPVRTWQLSILPLLCRLALIAFFIGFEILLHVMLYGAGSHYYLTADAMLFYIKSSLQNIMRYAEEKDKETILKVIDVFLQDTKTTKVERKMSLQEKTLNEVLIDLEENQRITDKTKSKRY